MTGPAKLRLATALKAAMQDRKLRIPMGDVALRADLHSVRKATSATGAPRLVVETEEEGDGSHADRFWAAALACGAADGVSGPFDGQDDGRVSEILNLDAPPADAGAPADLYRVDSELGMVISPHSTGFARYG